eukprot:TRINITY_DN1403_c0_g1_i1.p1 TRINITY_DN1403_c0_g1~~TRINITY_DN1403_c0_g1_i1.p1  ORF type:complete len:245 (+),score=33.84 TRINITY_DN1403_c0_g1_i1:145-879(+)
MTAPAVSPCAPQDLQVFSYMSPDSLRECPPSPAIPPAVPPVDSRSVSPILRMPEHAAGQGLSYGQMMELLTPPTRPSPIMYVDSVQSQPSVPPISDDWVAPMTVLGPARGDADPLAQATPNPYPRRPYPGSPIGLISIGAELGISPTHRVHAAAAEQNFPGAHGGGNYPFSVTAGLGREARSRATTGVGSELGASSQGLSPRLDTSGRYPSLLRGPGGSHSVGTEFGMTPEDNSFALGKVGSMV